ncbi:hypothetical protein DCF38_10970 [Edwardsiella piscicida]|uniref:hypothetical protein n=1 Tax=Edwardsiella piscicida TaxID=1263550 RepID=UPI000D5181C9|nr:hypothetical protein [Edwardsiella piscicida]UCQ40058.1 hypothetical protein DCF38_10970 [Edwardsiella piscicida]
MIYDFSNPLYIGQAFTPKMSVTVINPLGQSVQYTTAMQIPTDTWSAGIWTAIVKNSDGTMQVIHFEVIDPKAISSNIKQLQDILNEIDAVVESRLKNDGVITTTINNKTLVSESLSTLYQLRQHYKKRLADEMKKINKTNSSPIIKSITTFGR